MTTSAQIPGRFRADVVIGPYGQVLGKLEFAVFRRNVLPGWDFTAGSFALFYFQMLDTVFQNDIDQFVAGAIGFGC
jgi:hypothetical protein